MNISLARLKTLSRDVHERGPGRVVVDGNGTGTTQEHARKLYDVTWEIVLIRKDGWTLGAPMHLSDTAYMLWLEQWLCFMVAGDECRHDMRLWPHREQILEEAQSSKRKQ